MLCHYRRVVGSSSFGSSSLSNFGSSCLSSSSSSSSWLFLPKRLFKSSNINVTSRTTTTTNNSNGGGTRCLALLRGSLSSSYARNGDKSIGIRWFTSSSTAISSKAQSMIVMGGNQWSRLEPSHYQQTVQEAIEQGVTVIEAGSEGGELALANALRNLFLQHEKYIQQQQQNENQTEQVQTTSHFPTITVLQRFGYRTLILGKEQDDNNNNKHHLPPSINPELNRLFDGDLLVEVFDYQPTGNAFMNMSSAAKLIDTKDNDTSNPTLESPSSSPSSSSSSSTSSSSSNDVSTMDNPAHVVHNLGPDYLEAAIRSSPLVQLQQDFPNYKINLIAMLHNPETQSIALQKQNNKSIQQIQETIRMQLQQAFAQLQQLASQAVIAGYGIVSNGLCLPNEHPLHLNWKETVIEAALQQPSSKFTVLQFPANLLETNGFNIAHNIRTALQQYQDEDESLTALQLYAMRPLTCYPDYGTGTGHPFVMVDYAIPATMERTLQWTNTLLSGPPEAYQIALKTAMAHFDGDEILQQQQQDKQDGIIKPLTAEQRETLDGCKLLQSLLHDMDAGLSKIRSLVAHEKYLLQQVIPLIHDTFEGYDEDTARVLQSFFGAYSLAARHAIATNTRRLLVHGDADNATTTNIPLVQDLPQEQRLQDYALQKVILQQHEQQQYQNDKETEETTTSTSKPFEHLFDKIVVGFAHPDEVQDTLQIVDKHLSSLSLNSNNNNNE